MIRSRLASAKRILLCRAAVICREQHSGRRRGAEPSVERPPVHLGHVQVEDDPVDKLYTDVYQAVAERFNVPLFSPAALSALRGEVSFIRELRAVRDPVHLPNHHLGRYGRFLSVRM